MSLALRSCLYLESPEHVRPEEVDMSLPDVTSRAEWLAARTQLLAARRS